MTPALYFGGKAYAERNFEKLRSESLAADKRPGVFLHKSLADDQFDALEKTVQQQIPEGSPIGIVFKRSGPHLYASYKIDPPGKGEPYINTYQSNEPPEAFVASVLRLASAHLPKTTAPTSKPLGTFTDPGQALLAKPPITTHAVENQVPPLENYNLFTSDTILQDALKREGAGWAEPTARDFGQLLGRPETLQLGFDANKNTPEFQPFDKTGHRIDSVKFHPAYHKLMGIAKDWGLHSLSWTADQPGGHVARAGLFYLYSQIEQGTSCPISMTHAGIAVLQRQKHEQSDAFDRLLEKLRLNAYDPDPAYFENKNGLTMGMAMTEKQGGSDVRANSTKAAPVGEGGTGQPYALTGHKWFCSAPMSDMFLTLAYTDKGLSCFLVPRRFADDTPNRFEIQRLKDKLGDRSNASSEIEYDGTVGYLVGEEGRGVPTIIEMVHHTRLDCTLGSAAIMRQALVQAMHHAAHREAFGKKLIDQPAMKNVLADLAVESEAATLVAMRLARAFDDGARGDEEAQRLARIATAVSKYFVCKRAASGMIAEALEAHGGNGYVEESIMPRLYRQAPLNSIWEGSGNVMALDVLRAMREPENVSAFLNELNKARGLDGRYDRFLDELLKELSDTDNIQLRARRLVDRMALALEGALVLQHAPDAVKEAFCASRLARDWGLNYGTLPPHVDFDAIIEHARPKL